MFDEVLAFRRFLKISFKIPIRAEIKANYLLQNHGPFRPLGLSEPARFGIYRGLMRLQHKLGLSVFAVVIRKEVMAKKGVVGDPRQIAWDFLLQRLERFTTLGNHEVVVLHDEGESHLIRKLTRKARRAGSAGSMFGTGALTRPARRVVDDPSPRKSHESYLVQFADLDAYAAFRRIYPPKPRLGRVTIVPQDTWNELGAARYGKVNIWSGGPAGIVSWP